MDKDNTAYIMCECGSKDFIYVIECKVTSFFADEYTIDGFSRRPTLQDERHKLVCSSCGKFYKEDKYFSRIIYEGKPNTNS